MNEFTTTPILRGYEKIRDLMSAIYPYAVLCGGYAAYMCADDSVNLAEPEDIDLFLLEETDFERTCKSLNNLGFVLKTETVMAVTFEKDNFPLVQIIKPNSNEKLKTFGQMEEILSCFDFTVTRCGIKDEMTAIVDPYFHADMEAKRLRIAFMSNPIAQLMRIQKYAKKGFKASIAEIIHVLVEWDECDKSFKQTFVESLPSEFGNDLDTLDGDEYYLLQELLYSMKINMVANTTIENQSNNISENDW